MSQSNLPSGTDTPGAFFSSTEHDQVDQAEIHPGSNYRVDGTLCLSPFGRSSLHNNALTFQNDLAAAVGASGSPTPVTTRTLGHNFGQDVPVYPSLNADWNSSYPSEGQQDHTSQNNLLNSHRSSPPHSQNSPFFFLPNQQTHGYNRRRSLSHGDLDRFTPTPLNPTFLRLHGPHSRSSTQENIGRAESRPRHGRSISQGSSRKGRPGKSGTPYVLQGTPLTRGMSHPSTGISSSASTNNIATGGTRLVTRPISIYKPTFQKDIHGPPAQNGNTSPDLLTERMTDPVALEHSRRIIQIGVMAVHNPQKIDPGLEKYMSMSCHEKVTSQLDAVERHLKQDAVSYKEALQGCIVIRNALNQCFSASNLTNMGPGVVQGGWEKDYASSMIMGGQDTGLAGYLNDDDLMSALITMDNLKDFETSGEN